MALSFIADKSALARMHHTAVATRLAPLLIGGDVATCSVIDLEVLFSARSYADMVELRAERAAFPQVSVTQADFDRAVEVLEALARTGHHRAVGIPNLLIAAVAQRHNLTVLHYDKDFDLIATVTRQKVERFVPPGSVP